MAKYTHLKKTDRSFRLAYNRVRERIKFEECFFRASIWINCSWNDCDFYRIGFFWGCRLYGCTFTNCTFRGQHTYLGAYFRSCRFIDCYFKDVSFGRAVLKNCLFTGTFTNLVFYGKEAPPGWQTRFKSVDLSGVKLVDTDFRMGLKREQILTQPCSGHEVLTGHSNHGVQ
jgi:uncharacterized protein YjbI with pentapeptide repeats